MSVIQSTSEESDINVGQLAVLSKNPRARGVLPALCQKEYTSETATTSVLLLISQVILHTHFAK